MSGTYTEPNPLVRGEPLKFHLDGVMHENQFVKDFCYIALLNKKVIDTQCFRKGGLVYKDDEYILEYNFEIPPYIPPGDWQIKLVVRNNREMELGCLGAKFGVTP